MKLPLVTGIVAEYNPLHTGHLYQLAEARKSTAADAIIVVLSADFVQRGEPALLSMRERAKLAVSCGADLVLELPAIFSCHNAGVFANAAIDTLEATGLVQKLSFGVEQTDWDINSAADILINESNSFKTLLKKNLDFGNSFVQARAKTLAHFYKGAQEILQGSNNSLALNYAVRLKKINSAIQLAPLQRLGSLHTEKTAGSAFSSSTAIRNLIKNSAFDAAQKFLPAPTKKLLEEKLRDKSLYISDEKLWAALRTILLHASALEISKLAEISEGIENKFKQAALNAQSFDEWVEICASKRYPKGRIRRQAMHLLLGLRHFENRAAQRLGPPYLCPLAMNKTGQALLKQMKQTARLPIITKCGDAKFSAYASMVMRYDLLASELRLTFLENARLGSAHTEKIYIEE